MKLHKEKLMQSHRVKRRLKSAEEAARKLVRNDQTLGAGKWRG